jgi:hypothetical protein
MQGETLGMRPILGSKGPVRKNGMVSKRDELAARCANPVRPRASLAIPPKSLAHHLAKQRKFTSLQIHIASKLQIRFRSGVHHPLEQCPTYTFSFILESNRPTTHLPHVSLLGTLLASNTALIHIAP